MKAVIPYSIRGEKLLAEVGPMECPYCKCHSTKNLDDDIGWVETPIAHTPRQFMCLGCCYDLYLSCTDDDFESNPYRPLVAEAAAIEGVSEREFRCECIRHQIRAAEEKAIREDTTEYDERANRLRKLLTSLLQ